MSLRVLYVNHTSQMSGGERSLLLLLGALPDDAVAVVGCPQGPLADAARSLDVPCVPLTGTAGSLKLHPRHTPQALNEIWRAAREVRRTCAELRIGLVHANSIRAGLIAVLARRLGGPPAVAHIRDVLPAGPAGAATAAALCRGADALIANSRYTLEHLHAAPGRTPAAVVHNPVDLTRFDAERAGADAAALRRELGLAPGARLLSVVAQITPWKGQDVAIRALAGLRERGHDAHLAIAGSAKFVGKATRHDNLAYERSLRELVAELGVGAHVTFLGEREDVPALMAASDALLMPSWQEPFGRAVVESMAVGTPVLATEVGGTVEIITPGRDGLLLPPRDAARWVDELDRLLGAPERLQALAQAARERARAFTPAHHVAAVLRVYADVVPAAAALAP